MSTETNKVLYPGTLTQPAFDSPKNWPATTAVTQTTGEDITRNRDALLILERILGPNPHIGLFAKNPTQSTIAERLSILESGISEGRFILKTLRVQNAIEAAEDVNRVLHLILGATATRDRFATSIDVKGPLHVWDSGATDPRAIFDVGIKIASTSGKSTASTIQGTSEINKPLLKITDAYQSTIADTSRLALEVVGNVKISGYLEAQFAISHNSLLDINTDPVLDVRGRIIASALHVSRGNYHSHKRGIYNGTISRWIVDSNPQEDTYGVIDHSDLEPASIRTGNNQLNFVAQSNTAYHVTNGDDHDHLGGDGAPLQHKFLVGVDPKASDHVSSGDFHTHDPVKGDGSYIHTQSIQLEREKESSFVRLTIGSEELLSTILVAIDGALDTDKKKNDEQDQRLGTLEQFPASQKLTDDLQNRRLDSFDQSIASIAQTDAKQNQRLDDLETSVTSRDDRITALETANTAQTAALAVMNTSINTLSTRVTALEALHGDQVGDVRLTTSNALRAGYLWLDGAAVSRTAYAALFAVYGITHGPGDGLTTFNLPDNSASTPPQRYMVKY